MDHKFRGRFEAKVDQKGRLLLPLAFRDILKSSPIVITNSQYQGSRCLDGYPLKAWEALEKRIGKLSPLKAEVQAFQRFYLANGQVLEPDGHHRILLPKGLREFAGLKSEVFLVGMGEKLEIWQADKWNSLHQNLADSFEQTMSAVANLENENSTGKGQK